MWSIEDWEELDMKCGKCHERIQADTDDHYNSDHTEIKCPSCRRWQSVETNKCSMDGCLETAAVDSPWCELCRWELLNDASRPE